MAMDANAAVFGWAAMGALSEGVAWLGYPYLAELTQRPEYRRPSEIMAKEMTRKWIKLVSPLGKGGSGADRTGRAEKIQLIAQDLRKFRVRDAFRNALQLDGFFGRAHIFLDFGDRRSPELATPLIRNKSKIGINKLRRLQVVEPMWTYPAQYNASNPLEPTFYSPESWWVNGIEVSASRLLTLVGREVPDMLKPTYSFGGLSLSQMAKPYVDNWLRARQSVSDLMHSFSVMVLKTNMASMLTAPMNADGTLAFSSGDNLWNRIELFNLTRDNRGTMVVDKEMEELTNVSASLASLDKLQAQAQEQMASVVGIPLVVLLGITPSGLNASSEGEIRVFYDWILAQQEDLVRDPLSSVIDVIQINRFGEIDPDITFEFVPLYQLSAKELAEMREIDARTDAIYVEMGAMDPDDIRDTLGSDDEGRYSAVDFSGPAPGPPEVDEADEFGLPVPFPGMPKPGEKPAQPAQPAQPATPAKPASPAAPAQPARQRMPEPQAA
jgi:phage-related protein (TIGR01555 family)